MHLGLKQCVGKVSYKAKTKCIADTKPTFLVHFWLVHSFCSPGRWIETCRINKEDNQGEKHRKTLNIKICIWSHYCITQVSLYYSNYGLAACDYNSIERNRCRGRGNDPTCPHGVCCHVTGRRRARGNQQSHVSKGASPAHPPQVAKSRAMQLVTTRQVIASHAAWCSIL